MTEWRSIPSLKFYEASSDGRVRSVSRIRQTSNGQVRRYRSKELSPSSQNQHGHLKVQAGGKSHYVHRLVAEAFLGECPDGLQVAHCDGNATNNAVSNLRYCTATENNRDKIDHGTHRNGEKHPGAKLTAQEVAAVRRAISMGFKQKDIAESLGVCRSTIGAIATGRSWS